MNKASEFPRSVRLTLIFLFCLSVLFFVTSEKAGAEGQILEYGVDETQFQAPNPSFYLSESLYEDPSISVSIENGRADNSYYLAARIRIANPTQLRTSLASSNGKDTQQATRLAKRVNALFALSGDSFGDNKSGAGMYIVRQGAVKRHNPSGYFDVLLIDDKGDFHIIREARQADIDAFEGTIVNSFSFGPGLVVDGVVTETFEDRGYGPTKRAQRVAICQVAPLEYMCVVTSGPDHNNSTGLTIDEFTQLITSLGPVQNAYNLDGGTSAWMVWRGEKINAFGSSKYRTINDIIFFVTAWKD
ncbi:MAG: phosphodiester glycosidase family protein [Clostridia bacterium]|nr:phosphodiester glycosidase family protein [Clostridia bacterium]